MTNSKLINSFWTPAKTDAQKFCNITWKYMASN